VDIPANGHGGPVTLFSLMTGSRPSSADRAALRTRMRKERREFVEGLPPAIRVLAFRALPSPVRARIPAGATVALYAPTQFEVPTRNIAIQLGEAGHRLCLPAFESVEAPMHFCPWLPDDPLMTGPHRVQQPALAADPVTPDVLFIPLVAFDSQLNRMGQGGGHYDRTLAELPGALRIGLAWSCQQVDALDVESWDMPMDIIVTEQRFFERQAH
jgi:5-formyltetrahydrofolate cyclo-ligase